MLRQSRSCATLSISGVVIATPTSIKAIVLKYIEAREALSDVRKEQDCFHCQGQKARPRKIPRPDRHRSDECHRRRRRQEEEEEEKKEEEEEEATKIA